MMPTLQVEGIGETRPIHSSRHNGLRYWITRDRMRAMCYSHSPAYRGHQPSCATKGGPTSCTTATSTGLTIHSRLELAVDSTLHSWEIHSYTAFASPRKISSGLSFVMRS